MNEIEEELCMGNKKSLICPCSLVFAATGLHRSLNNPVRLHEETFWKEGRSRRSQSGEVMNVV